MARYAPAFETYRGEVKACRFTWLQWRPTLLFAIIAAVLFMVSVKTIITVPDSAFLYFNF